MQISKQAILNRARKILSECYGLVPEHSDKLDRIRFRVSARMTRAAGKARPGTGEIVLSLPFFADQANYENEFFNTVTHEIAHVLSPPVRLPGSRKRQSHGPAWKAMHRRIGGNGERCHELELAEGYAKRQRAKRVETPCGCGCGEMMQLGPTRAKRHAACLAAGYPGYAIKGHCSRQRGPQSLRRTLGF